MAQQDHKRTIVTTDGEIDDVDTFIHYLMYTNEFDTEGLIYSSHKHWETIKEKVSKKAIIYTIMDQDATYKKYIGPNWPNIRVFYNANQFWCFAYPWKQVVPKSQQPYLEGSFMCPNIINNHGPLFTKYYSYEDGQKQEGDSNHFEGDISKIAHTDRGNFSKYDFISEGDSPAFLHLVDVGLDNYEDPSRGGWSGRFEQSTENPYHFEDGEASADLNPETGEMDKSYPQTRWIKPMQLDFAARADWCIKPFEEANHPPQISVSQGNSINAKPGEKVVLNLSAEDIDEHPVFFNVWPYAEAGDGAAIVELNIDVASVKIPNAKRYDDC